MGQQWGGWRRWRRPAHARPRRPPRENARNIWHEDERTRRMLRQRCCCTTLDYKSAKWRRFHGPSPPHQDRQRPEEPWSKHPEPELQPVAEGILKSRRDERLPLDVNVFAKRRAIYRVVASCLLRLVSCEGCGTVTMHSGAQASRQTASQYNSMWH